MSGISSERTACANAARGKRAMGKRQKLRLAIDAAIDAWCGKPFVWGESDCLLSLSDIIAAATGEDPAAYFRGRYTTALGALRVTRRFGGFEGALAYVARAQGWREIEPEAARVGDIGILKGPQATRRRAQSAPLCAPIVGVIKHQRLWIARNQTAFAAVPTRAVARAFRV